MRVKLTDGQLTRSNLLGQRQVIQAVEVKRVYEKLRKRSYRKIGNYNLRAWDESWWPFEHEAYVQGVRDALKELTR